MALNAAALIVEKQAFVAAFPFISIHNSGAVSSSANESTAARVNAGWAVNGTTGVASFTNKAFTGGGNGSGAVRVGYWSAATGGTYGGGFLLTGDQSFNSNGEYTVTSGSETPSAT